MTEPGTRATGPLPAPPVVDSSGGGGSPPGRSRRWIREAIGPIVVVALVLARLWPVLTTLETRLWGPFGIDQSIQLWFHWWVDHAVTIGQDPTYCTWINYPTGQALGAGFVNFVHPLLTRLVSGSVGLVGAINLLYLAVFAMTGIAGYALGRVVSGGRVFGVLTGVTLSLNPWMLAQVEVVGLHTENVDIALLALFLLALLRCTGGGWMRGAVAGGVAGAAVLVEAHHGVYLVLLAFGWTVWRMADGTPGARRTALSQALAGAAVLAAVSAPGVLLATSSLATHSPTTSGPLLTRPGSKRYRLLRPQQVDGEPVSSLFLSWALLGSLAAGAVAVGGAWLLISRRRRRKTDAGTPEGAAVSQPETNSREPTAVGWAPRTWDLPFWLVAVVGFYLISLGPYLALSPHAHPRGYVARPAQPSSKLRLPPPPARSYKGSVLPLPYLFLRDYVPVMGREQWPERYYKMVLLLMLLLLAWAWRRGRTIGRHGPVGLVLCLACLALVHVQADWHLRLARSFERPAGMRLPNLLTRAVTTRKKLGPAAALAPRGRGPGAARGAAVLVLPPADWTGTDPSAVSAFLDQTRHRRPLVNTFLPPGVVRRSRPRQLRRSLQWLRRGDPGRCADLCGTLGRLGVGHVLLRPTPGWDGRAGLLLRLRSCGLNQSWRRQGHLLLRCGRGPAQSGNGPPPGFLGGEGRNPKATHLQ